MAGYDASKAATFNKLRQQGLSEDAAAAQAGIPLGDGNYVISGKYNADGTKNPNPGAIGADVSGSGKIAGVDYDKVTAADVAESNRFDKGLASSSNFEQVDYQVAAKNPPGKVTPVNYTTTSTETVSGGGSTSVVSGPRVPNATSQSIQPAINAKQAEINQFTKDNPSDFARKKQGLPPLSAEEKQQRQEKLDTLSAERGALKNQQIDAESTTPATITTVPNTTTTTQTVSTGKSSVNQAVDPNEDQKLSQQNETQLDATTSLATDGSYKQAAPLGADGQPLKLVPFEPVSVSTPGTGDGSYSQAAPLGADGQPMQLVPMDVEPTPEQAAATNNVFNDRIVEPAVAEDPYEQARLAAEARFDADVTYGPTDVTIEQEAATNNVFNDRTTEPTPVETGSDQSLENQQKAQQDSQYGIPEQTADEAQNEANFMAGLRGNAKSQGTLQSRYKQPNNGDWRVRLSLAPNSNYLYNAGSAAGILAPLAATNGVIFPYTPNISTTYTADYEKYNLIHSNYRGLFYKSSSVGDVQIRGTFTAQDTREAGYLLAVIHFFRSVTKMFYGQDAQRGTPPPLVYLSGYGGWQFNNHACVVSSFNYTLPNEVDYIRTDAPNNFGPNMSNRQTPRSTSPGGINFAGAIRLANALIPSGAIPVKPAQNSLFASVNNTNECNYVPTKMEIDITLIPVQTRSQVSKQFSLEGFASGRLLKGGFW